MTQVNKRLTSVCLLTPVRFSIFIYNEKKKKYAANLTLFSFSFRKSENKNKIK